MPAADRKGKYQPWSHEEFVSDPHVRRMSPLARKTYMTLLHEAFVCSERPYLPDDEHTLEIMADCTDAAEWASIRDSVLRMFYKTEVDGQPLLANKRLLQDWDTLLEIREKRSEAGKASGAARRNKASKPEQVFDFVEQCSIGVEHETNKLSKEKLREEKEVNLSEETEDPDMKAYNEIQLISQRLFGKPAKFYGSYKDDLRRLEMTHKGSAVARAFEEWAEGLDEVPDALAATFLSVADDLLNESSPVKQAGKSPEVVGLVRELTYLSDGKVAFGDRQKPILADLLADYSQSEILGVFRVWLEDQDLSDPKTVQFAAKNFAERADALCYAARRKKTERTEADAERESTKKRLETEAEHERLRAETDKKKEETLFDPLA